LAQDSIEVQRSKVQRLKRRIDKLKGIDKRLSLELQKLDRMKRSLVPGENPQVMATNIQNSFLKKSSDAGVEVLVYRIGSRRRWRGYQLAVSIFNIKTTVSQFVKLLEDIASEKRLQRLNNVNISAPRGRSSHLRINMEVEALFLGEKAKL